ncbi:MAG: helix-turn-helix domain-containing protein [Leptospiraceae bacterium]|nr:helix-turn-helix domain-containing protein [Leptospiraceae bacterium]
MAVKRKQVKNGRKRTGTVNKKAVKKNAKGFVSKFAHLYDPNELIEVPFKSITPEQYKTICMLLDGFTLAQTGSALKIPVSTIQNWLYLKEAVAIKFQEAYLSEARRRMEIMRLNSDSIAFDMYDLLMDWIQYMKRRKGVFDAKEVAQITSYLKNSSYIMSDDTKAKEEKSREKILAGLESLIEEKVLESQMMN